MSTRRVFLILFVGLCLCLAHWSPAWSQPAPPPTVSETPATEADPGANANADAPKLNIKQLFRAGGAIGIIICGLSVAMVALIVEHLFSIRRSALMPEGLTESVHQHIAQGRFTEAEQQCKLQPSFLAHVLGSGLAEVGLGYSAVEKAMEDASTEQAARLFRKIEYLSVIGTIAPMLGLLGTVWGMILAFLEFETKANPQVSELAPGIYKALVTTLLGLGVAVPALASFAIFRNRIDELVAEASLSAEHVFVDFKRSLVAKRKEERKKRVAPRPQEPQISPVGIEPERTG